MITFIIAQAISFAVPCSYSRFPVRIQTNQEQTVARWVSRQYPGLRVEACSWNNGNNGGVQISTKSKEQQDKVFTQLSKVYGQIVSKGR